MWKELIKQDLFKDVHRKMSELPQRRSSESNGYYEGLIEIWDDYWRWISSNVRLKGKFR